MTTSDKPKHAGGRKPLPPEQRKERVQVYLAPATMATLRAMAQEGETLGQTIDRIVAAR